MTVYLAYTLLGLLTGFVAGLLGVGGGLIIVPALTWLFARQGFTPAYIIHLALGTSAAIGLPIAVAGTVGYAWSGRLADGLPSLSVGFVYLPALIAIAAGSWLTAPLDARAAHRLPVGWLKRIFAGLLYLLGLRMA